MAAFVQVLSQISNSPVTSITICITVAIWVRIFHGRLDGRIFSYSYNEIFSREQYWKVLVVPYCHLSFLHLIINILTLWAIRDFEVVYGSWYFFRYTLVLIIAEAAISLSAINFISRTTSRLGLYQGAIDQHPLRNSSTSGLSGVLLSWLTYQSISSVEIVRPFYLIGLLPIPWVLAPLFMIFISPLYVPRLNGVSNAISLFSGYMLAFGVLKVLPDLYWSVCFLFNIVVFLVVKSGLLTDRLRLSPGASSRMPLPSEDSIERYTLVRTLRGSRGDLEVVEIVSEEPSDGPPGAARDDDDDEEEDGEEEHIAGANEGDVEMGSIRGGRNAMSNSGAAEGATGSHSVSGSSSSGSGLGRPGGSAGAINAVAATIASFANAALSSSGSRNGSNRGNSNSNSGNGGSSSGSGGAARVAGSRDDHDGDEEEAGEEDAFLASRASGPFQDDLYAASHRMPLNRSGSSGGLGSHHRSGNSNSNGNGNGSNGNGHP